jgi:hypothetical protein
MGDVVNLRSMRKRAVRQKQAERAAESRVIYGRSKSDRVRDAVQREKADKVLDQHLIETGDDR